MLQDWVLKAKGNKEDARGDAIDYGHNIFSHFNSIVSKLTALYISLTILINLYS